MLLQNLKVMTPAVKPSVGERASSAPAPAPSSRAEAPSVGTRPLIEPTAVAEFAPAEPPKEEVKAAVKEANTAMAAMSASLSFEIDEDTKRTVVKVVDTTDNSVIRQIPSKEMLEIAKALDKLQGMLLRTKA